MSYYQFLFNLNISVTHLGMIRAYIYLLYYDFKNNFRNFEWLNFLRISNEQILIKEYFFSAKEAKSYLFLIKFFIRAIEINMIMYMIGVSGVIGRVLIMAYLEIPFKWFLFSTLPNAISFSFATYCAYYLYNYFTMIFFANCMFIHKSLKSLSSHYSISSLQRLKKKKLNLFVKQNLKQFNRLLILFKYGQMNFNYTFSYCSGLIVICFSYPYILLFTNLDVPSFVFTLCLYIQSMLITIWLLIKINSYFIEEVCLLEKTDLI